jgi:hypothetical protein
MVRAVFLLIDIVLAMDVVLATYFALPRNRGGIATTWKK